MKYTTSIEINAPIEKVIELFDSTPNYYQWMEGLENIEHISGNDRQPGAKSIFKFKTNNREIEMIETVVSRNLPKEFKVNYEAKGVFNIVNNKFEALPNNHTKYINEQEFQFRGLMKIIGLLMPGAFKKQSMKYLTDFKNFVENQ